jgi:hypothetical protein
VSVTGPALGLIDGVPGAPSVGQTWWTPAGASAHAAPAFRHADHVAGVLQKLAPECRLWAAAALDGPRLALACLQGLEWLAEHRVRVLCLPFGLPFHEPVVAAALGQLSSDMLCVAAAGNARGLPPQFPASLPDVLAVGAAGCSSATQCDLWLDRSELAGAGDTAHALGAGSSLASAVVAARAARMLVAEPALTAAGLRDRMMGPRRANRAIVRSAPTGAPILKAMKTTSHAPLEGLAAWPSDTPPPPGFTVLERWPRTGAWWLRGSGAAWSALLARPGVSASRTDAADGLMAALAL